MSRRGKPVAFQFYGQDWLTDPHVRILSDAARSCYIDLLCHAHADRGIFEEPGKIRLLLGRPRRGWAKLWSELERFWPVVGDHLRMNSKLALVIAAQDEKRRAGAKGGERRQAKRKQSASKAQANVNPPTPTPTPSPEEKKKATTRKPGWKGVIPESLSAPAFIKEWERFLQHRREKRSAVTQTNGDKLMEKFEAWGMARATAALDHTTTKGWTGIREPENRRGSHKRTPVDIEWDRIQEEKRRNGIS